MWTIRAYQEGDENRILDLWRIVYPESRYDQEAWLKWWRWLYRENPAGWGKIWLAEQDEKLVGQYACIPMDVKVGDDVVRVLESVDVMTHPNYSHQGVSSAMARYAAEAGSHIIIGFPNEASYRIIMRSGRFNIGSMQRMHKILDWKSFSRREIRTGILSGVTASAAKFTFEKVFFRASDPPFVEGLSVNEVESFDERINKLWLKSRGQFMIMVARTEPYLNWRYGAPGRKYTKLVAEKAGEILGYLVLKHAVRKGVKVGHIFDLVSQSEEVMHHLLARAIENCRLNGDERVTYPFIANKSYRRILKRNGFVSLPLVRRQRFCAYSAPSDISKRILESPRNWLVQLGDSDATFETC